MWREEEDRDWGCDSFPCRKSRAHVLTAEGKEEKLGVVSEAMKEDGNTVPATSQRP
jgi:hypothetical protein